MEKLIPLSAKVLKSFSDTPEAILTEDISLQIAVASHADTPRSLLEALANSDRPEIAEAAQMHVNYGGELTEAWQAALEDKLKFRYLGQNDRLGVELLKIASLPVYFLSEYVPPEYLIQGLKNPYLTKSDREQLLFRLAKEQNLEPRLQVAESLDTPVAILEQLMGDIELSIRIAVEYNPNCPLEFAESVKEQHQVASNWDTNSQKLEDLSNSSWNWIRLAVAQNPSASEETLLKLAEDRVFKIQLAVAKNIVTSPNVLQVLAEHSSKDIQTKVAKHPLVTEEILHSLFDTQQQVIQSRENLPTSILERIFNKSPEDPQVPLFLSRSGMNISFFLRQPNTPVWILDKFGNIDLEQLRVYAEQEYPKSPIENQIAGWINDRCSSLIELAKHPKVSREILEQLANFPNQRVKLAVAQNSLMPQTLKEQLLKQLLANADGFIKVQIASNIETPVAILEQLSPKDQSGDCLTQALVKIAPDLTPHLLRKIKEFINRHQAPELILFWLQQGKEFQVSIFNDWDKLLTSLSDKEREALEQIASQKSTEKWQGKFTVQRKGKTSRSANSSEPQKILLQRLMYLLNTPYNSDINKQDVVTALLGNPSTPKNLREQLWQQHQKEADNTGFYSEDAKLRMALAYNPAIPETERREYFEQLIASGNDIPLAKNYLTPQYILEQLATNNRTKYEVAENTHTSTDLLRKIALEANEQLLILIANNPSTPADLLIKLANYPVTNTINNAESIRNRAIKNLSLPIFERYRILIDREQKNQVESAKRILSKRHEFPYILDEISSKGINNNKIFTAINSQTPVATLEKLAEDSDRNIRYLVAHNSNLSLTAISKLAHDNRADVRKAIASQTNTPSNILETLAADSVTNVRAAVAGNNSTPAKILEQLLQDSEITVIIKVASNPNTSNNLLEDLALNQNIEVRRAVALNQNSSETIKELLKDLLPAFQTNTRFISSTLHGLSRIYNPHTDDLATILSEYINSQVPLVRLVALLHPLMPVNILEEAVDSIAWLERYAIANNPNTPTEVKQQLARDSNQIVRAVAIG